VAVCELVFGDEEVFACSDEFGVVISAVNWRERVTKDMDKCLQYLIAAHLLDTYYDMPVHAVTEVRGCPGDYCDKLEDLTAGLQKAEFCPECRRLVVSRLNTEIPMTVWVAVQRILDNVARKPFCCVLMPFGNDLAAVHSVIQQLAAEKNYRCGRADDTLAAREIWDVMQEMVGRAELIVAVLTRASPNVLFEIGYVYGIKKEKRMVLLLEKGEDIPIYFRTRQVLQYNGSEDGLRRLARALQDCF
jgi:hypothetical protein